MNHVKIKPINPSFYENLNPNQLQHNPPEKIRRKILRNNSLPVDDEDLLDENSQQTKPSAEHGNADNDQLDLETARIEGDEGNEEGNDLESVLKNPIDNQNNLPHFGNTQFILNENVDPSQVNAQRAQ